MDARACGSVGGSTAGNPGSEALEMREDAELTDSSRSGADARDDPILNEDYFATDIQFCTDEFYSPPPFAQNKYSVCVRNAYKYYGSKKNPVMILNGLNMTVPKGAIYGLLGASGCGKTTLLNCIVGRRRLDAGRVWVLGGSPGSQSCGIPGPQFGYMPQETAMYGEFSIRETLMFFGWISGMNMRRIKARVEFLEQLLMFPDVGQKVKTLSGGQQRRVSFAAALIHEPQLLILDEPTVGLDPTLRESIWNHLKSITQSGDVTVIITSHYIDETRNAHLIALMRGGYFLAEEPPNSLLNRFGLQTLEAVFLKLSVEQSYSNQTPIHQKMISANDDDIISLESGGERSCRKFKKFGVSWNHLKAMLWKNIISVVRDVPFMLAICLLPIVQSVIFCVSIGQEPTNLAVAVVNYELNNSLVCTESMVCGNLQLSCHYLKYLQRRGLIMLRYDSEDDAKTDVIKGKVYASITFHHNYSTALQNRLEHWTEPNQWELTNSEVNMFIDVANKMISYHIQKVAYETFKDFIEDYLNACDTGSKWLISPIDWKQPVYGTRTTAFLDFVIPGLILTFTSILSMGLTSLTIVNERKEGVIERSLVIGITGVELMLSHILSQIALMILQSTITLLSSVVLFNLTMKGSILLLVLFTFLAGTYGISIGFFISSVCDRERTAFITAMGLFFPNVLLCGVVWPIEGMHRYLKSITNFLPLTLATDALRSVMLRSWGFPRWAVRAGFLSITSWIAVMAGVSIALVKLRRN